MDKRRRRWNALVPLWSLLAVTLVGCATSSTSGSGAATSKATPSPTSLTVATSPVASWQAGGSSPDATTSFVFAPGAPQTGYLCTGGPSQQIKGPRLYKTSDGGTTWKAVASEPSPDLPCRVFADATAPNDLFLQQILEPNANSGPPLKKALWRSRDGGATWKQLTVMNGWGSLAVAGGRLVAQGDFTPSANAAGDRPCDASIRPGPASDLYASDNGGITWHSIGQAIERQQLLVEGMAMMGTTIFAQADTLPKNECDRTLPVSSLWKSGDGGATWTKAALPACKLLSLSFMAQADGSGFVGVALVEGLDRAQPAAFDLLYSGDSGATWAALPAFAPPDGKLVDANTGNPPNFAVTPSGAVVAEFTTLTTDGGEEAKIYLLRPSTTLPAWSRYAPGGPAGNQGQWQMVHGAQGDALWGLGYTISGSPLSYLPLP